MSGSKNFFISYTGYDVGWAEWIAWQLESEGHSVIIQKWDFRVGEDFLDNMDRAVRGTTRTIALLSPAYLASKYCRMELNAARKYDKLFPIRIAAFDNNPLVGSTTAYLDLVGLEPEESKALVLKELEAIGARSKPNESPILPDRFQLTIKEPIHFPGKEPSIWHIPFKRNPYFIGRDEVLESLFQDLQLGQSDAPVQVLSGIGGVGKTQLAIEYAYRYRSYYDIIWHIRSEHSIDLAIDFAALAEKMGLPEKDEKEQEKVIEAVRQELRQRDDWLLIFDNVELEGDVWDFLPQTGAGQVLITSRSNIWNRLPIRSVEPLGHEKSIDFLIRRTELDEEQNVAELADLFDGLPLALEQAGAYIKATGTPFVEYIKLFESRRKDLWDKEKAPLDYKATIATTWNISMKKVEQEVPLGRDILRFFSFLAPDNIPRDFLDLMPNFVPNDRGDLFRDSLAVNEAIEALRLYSLIELKREVFSVHRLVQTVTRDRIPNSEQRLWPELAINVLTEACPSGNFDLSDWPQCELLLPHAKASLSHAEKYNLLSEEAGLLSNQMGFYLHLRAVFNEAEQFYLKTLKVWEEILEENDSRTIAVLNSLGLLYDNQGRYNDAERLYLRSLRILEKISQKDPGDMIHSYNNLAAVRLKQGHHKEAMKLFQESLTICETTLGRTHPFTALSYSNIASVYVNQGRYKKAERFHKKSLTLKEGSHGANHPFTATSYKALGELYEAQGRHKEAESLYMKAFSIYESSLGENHPDTISVQNKLHQLRQGINKAHRKEPFFRRIFNH